MSTSEWVSPYTKEVGTEVLEKLGAASAGKANQKEDALLRIRLENAVKVPDMS